MSDAGRATEGSTAPADAIRREIEHAVAFMDEALDGTAVPKRDPFRLVLKGLALNLMAMAHLADAVLDAAARVGTGPKGARTAPVDADEAQHQAEVFGLAARAGMAREASGMFRALRVQHWLAGGVAAALALATTGCGWLFKSNHQQQQGNRFPNGGGNTSIPLPPLPMPTMRPSRTPMSALTMPQWSRITEPVITRSGAPSDRVASD